MNPLLLSAILQVVPTLIGKFFDHANAVEKEMPDAKGAEKMDAVRPRILAELDNLAKGFSTDLDPDEASALQNVAAIIDQFEDAWPELVAIFSNFCALGKKAGIIKPADQS